MLFWPKEGRCCCGPCCTVARFEVRECDGGALVNGASVAVTKDGAAVASGTTDDTGTVALAIPQAAGIVYDVAVSRDGETQHQEFTSGCGVAAVEVAFGETQQICITVVDADTNTPVAGIPVALTTPTPGGTGTVTVAEGVTDSGGEACLEVEGGGVYGLTANGGGLGGSESDSDTNPDYTGVETEIVVPNCQDFEVEVPIGLIANHPGCYQIILWGCWCGKAGVSATIKGITRRNAGSWNTCTGIQEGDEPWSETYTTDATGRIWVCSGEGHVPPFFGIGYNPDTNQYDCWSITGIRVDPPAPYVWQEVEYAGIGVVNYLNPNADIGFYRNNSGGWFIHMFTPGRIINFGDPDGPFYFCGSDCNSQIPETVTINWDPVDPTGWTLGASTTLTNTAELWYAPTVYEYCDGNEFSSTLIRLTIPYGAYDCGDFDAERSGQGRATLQMYRVFNSCDSAVFNGSEKVLEMVSVGEGTTACPIDFEMESWKFSVNPGPPVTVTRDPITVRATVTG